MHPGVALEDAKWRAVIEGLIRETSFHPSTFAELFDEHARECTLIDNNGAYPLLPHPEGFPQISMMRLFAASVSSSSSSFSATAPVREAYLGRPPAGVAMGPPAPQDPQPNTCGQACNHGGLCFAFNTHGCKHTESHFLYQGSDKWLLHKCAACGGTHPAMPANGSACGKSKFPPIKPRAPRGVDKKDGKQGGKRAQQ
jgi:hypothetical protein